MTIDVKIGYDCPDASLTIVEGASVEAVEVSIGDTLTATMPNDTMVINSF